MTFRVCVDGVPLSKLYTHPKTADVVAMALVEALMEVSQ
jgi:hypothetical protein